MSVYAAKAAWQWVGSVIGWTAGRIFAKRGACLWLPNIALPEARCQVDRGINALLLFFSYTINFDESNFFCCTYYYNPRKKAPPQTPPQKLFRYKKYNRCLFTQFKIFWMGFGENLFLKKFSPWNSSNSRYFYGISATTASGFWSSSHGFL